MSYADPVLTVTAVHDHSGRSVDRVTVTSLRVDRRPALRELIDNVRNSAQTAPGTGTTSAGRHSGFVLGAEGQLVCDVPCGFGTTAGRVRVAVRADDGSRGTRAVTAGYGGATPGCGGALVDGSEVALELHRPR